MPSVDVIERGIQLDLHQSRPKELPCRPSVTLFVGPPSTASALSGTPGSGIDILPPRCFIYLFPSYVTWFLLATLVLLTYVDAEQSPSHDTDR